MPAALTYPGVYVEEIPSGVRTIAGVATSITAFVGRARRGPVDRAIVINSFGDFERRYGGLWLHSQLGYAVRDFFLNGGSQAIIVRLYASNTASFASPAAEAAAIAVAAAATGDSAAAAAAAAETKANTYPNDPEKSAAKAVALVAKGASEKPDATAQTVQKAAKASIAPARAPLTIKELSLEAAYEGAWGGKLRGEIVASPNAEVALAFGVDQSALFNLTVRDASPGGTVETYLNVTVVESPRRIDRVLESESALVRVKGALPGSVSAGTDAITTAEADVGDAKTELDDLIKSGASQADIDAARTLWETKREALAAKYEEADQAASDGSHLGALHFLPDQGMQLKKGLYALEQSDLFNLLCIPPYKSVDGVQFDAEPIVLSAATAYCERRRAFHVIDPPSGWTSKEAAIAGLDTVADPKSRNAAIFFPRLRQPNLLRDNGIENFAPCGAVAGIFARTDASRGVWKAPAGLDATLVGVPQLSVPLTDAENGELNPLGINCLRAMPASGRVVWGARTLRGADQLADEYKYTPVRRTALFIEESLFRGLKWVVFEPNDEPLWAQIRLNVGAFMHNLFRQGAFQGSSPRDAYFVRCDKDTTTQNDINLGVVNVMVGFAPLKPAEFVVLRIQQIAGQIDV
ncbi:phage tail sheath family protein [Lysobacter sp. CA196]|uniref:phage tail sheath family protein n=1 Tax=Lysobacter sp. CA196 TaxID=3455606 RepID=UPI003F8D300F